MFFIVGPTSAGKTEIAAEVAVRIGAEIISADAFQIYRGLDLLTAKPPAALLSKVPHHLIGEIPLTQPFDVAQFLALARARAEEIAARGRRVLVVGGTGLYVRALTHGLSELPPADASLRAKLEALPLAELQARFAILDPIGAATLDTKNKRRLIRALEVCELTGKPFSSFRDAWSGPPHEAARGFLLYRERDDLHARINLRVEQMFKQGVTEEVSAAGEIGATAAQALGWREALACARGELSREEAVARVQQATRRYAKRQLTWFKRDSIFEPLNLTTSPPENVVQAIAHGALSRPVAQDV